MLTMKTFKEFLSQASEEQTTLLSEIENKLSKKYKIENFLEESQPYLFVHLPEGCFYKGLRLYFAFDSLSYREQEEPEATPVGVAHSIDISEIKGNKKIVEFVAEEFDKVVEQAKDVGEEQEEEKEKHKNVSRPRRKTSGELDNKPNTFQGVAGNGNDQEEQATEETPSLTKL